MRILILTLFTLLMIEAPRASQEFLEVLEDFNWQSQTCEGQANVCSRYLTSLRCAFEARGGEAIAAGHCSYIDSQGDLKATYDELAFRLYEKLMDRGVEAHFNGREFKITLDKVSCQRRLRGQEISYTCRII